MRTLPNVMVTKYDDIFDVTCECVGKHECGFKLSDVIPATPEAECSLYNNGACMNHVRKMDALRALAAEIIDYVDDHEFDDL